MKKTIYFAHGKESGPLGTKILGMMEVAKSLGYYTESPSYEGLDNPNDRVKKLLDLKPTGSPLILVGSSMGSYISTIASRYIKPDGLFLLAPAFYIEKYPEQAPKPIATHVEIIHGYNDEIIPAQNIFNYANQYKICLHLLDADHRLSSVLEQIKILFKSFLERF